MSSAHRQITATVIVAVFLTTFVVPSRSFVVGTRTSFDTIADDDSLKVRNRSRGDAEHERYIRGERAVVIARRLPDMKVHQAIFKRILLAGQWHLHRQDF